MGRGSWRNAFASPSTKRASPWGGQSIRISVSVGVAVSHSGAGDCQSVYERADRALYASKAGGRNLVTFFRDRDAA